MTSKAARIMNLQGHVDPRRLSAVATRYRDEGKIGQFPTYADLLVAMIDELYEAHSSDYPAPTTMEDATSAIIAANIKPPTMRSGWKAYANQSAEHDALLQKQEERRTSAAPVPSPKTTRADIAAAVAKQMEKPST